MMECSVSEEKLAAFCKNLPKAELHAHLNGSFSPSTLQKLINLKICKSGSKEGLEIPTLSSTDDLSKCFQVFGLIHKITDSLEAVYTATCDVIEDFYNDGVRYLELRTTPKEIDGRTQREYIETVLRAVEVTCHRLCNNIHVKLLLSVDRKRSTDFAIETLQIAEESYVSHSNVVGIDFSGDPITSNIQPFVTILEKAEQCGFKLSIHIAEVPNRNEEIKNLLDLQPDRLGHGTYLHPLRGGDPSNFDHLLKLKIPLEFCLTSNIVSKTVSSYEEHHLKLFNNMHYPFSICTDDKGIFCTTLSNEYYLAGTYYNFTPEDLFEISSNSLDYIFSSNLKHELKETWKKSYNFAHEFCSRTKACI